jgi:hypothetical protein
MNRKKQLDNLREQLMQTIREAAGKGNGCIGTFYKNKGCRYFIRQTDEEYDDSPIVVAHIPDISTYGNFIAATVFDLYVDTELRLMCTLNGESGEDWDEPVENLMTDSLLCITDWLRENGFIPELPDNPYRCANCGSTNLQKTAWVRPNKDNAFVDYFGEENDEEDQWCDDCEEHAEFLPEDKFLKEVTDWWKKLGIYAKEEISGLWLDEYEVNEAGKTEFQQDADKLWEGLSLEEKIEKWKTYKEENQ